MFDFDHLLKSFPHARVHVERDGDVAYFDDGVAQIETFISRRESSILFDQVSARPARWLEIGTYVGWSAAVIRSAGAPVICLDPSLHLKCAVGYRAHENWMRAGLLGSITPLAMHSTEFFKMKAALEEPTLFAGVFIDGEHKSPHPLRDAQGATRLLDDNGCIILHDAKLPGVREAIDWLAKNGFEIKEEWQTMHGMAIATRD